MSLPLPKRIRDMPPLLIDSEDDQTPAKQNKDVNEVFSEKTINDSCRPKRVCELSPFVNSDKSTDENDSFNCAILDNSFILSPSKSENTSNKIPDNHKINNLENTYSKDTGYWDSRDFLLTELKSLKLNETRTKTSTKTIPTESFVNDKPRDLNKNCAPPSCPKFSFLDSAKNKLLNEFNNSITGLPSSKCTQEFQHKEKENMIENDSKSCKHLIIPETSTKLVSILKSSGKVTQVNKYIETPYNIKKTFNNISDINHITPQVKLLQNLSKSNYANNMCSTTTQQRSRNCMKNEFKSPKVLFQTPYSSSRPPIVNNSISLSLDDTVKDKPTTLDSLNKIFDSLETKYLYNTKKSCDDLFNSKIEEKIVDAIDNFDEKDKKIISINKTEYVICDKLGSGGSSTVFLSRQRGAKKIENFALKIVDLKGDRSVVEGYLNETKLLAKLQGNINVVSLYAYEHRPKESLLYMLMEKGESDLHKILQSYTSSLPLYDLVNYWYQMLQCVNYIHGKGVIHSDLKPPNFLMVNGRLKLIDFGIASNISYDSTSIIKFSQAGTFNYISPEALTDTSTECSPMKKNQPKIKISFKSDVWSLGCIFYLFLFKKTPFGHIKNINSKANAISNPTTVIEYPELANYYPPMLLEMTKKCLIHNPKKRISVSELLEYPLGMIIPIERNKPLP